MRTGVFIAVVTSVLSAAASAQDPIVAEPGARLRLTIASGHQRMNGKFVRPKMDSLEFAWSDSRGDRLQQIIALSEIAHIEVSGSRSHPLLKTGLSGAVIGMAFGVAAGMFLGDPNCRGSGCFTEAQAMKNYGLGFSAVGFTIGFVRAAHGFDRWVPATVPGWSP
jgi:hypothetical protein